MKKNIIKDFAKEIAKSASDLKAVNIKVLDLTKLSAFTDFFVICTGTSDRHVQSIADKIVLDQKKKGENATCIEGYNEGEWVLVDFGTVVAHVFLAETREFYNIEKLWGDATKVVFKL